jgi:excinuclease ABC subunit C
MPRTIFSSMNGTNKDIDPASELREEDEDSSLPELEVDGATAGTLASGRAAIASFAKLAPSASGVYRMIDAQGDVLYVGKAKNIRKRVTAYARPTGHDSRISRMIAATVSLEFVSTKTETEALLLEANLIKRLRPRFNVLLRDDKSFPYILITSDHWAPQILKHRGARARPGHYYGPFASAGAVNRTINALERAFLLRSCSDSYFEARTRPCLLFQIKRCSAPCTREIDFAGYCELVKEANEFLSGRSQSVQKEMAREMDKASATLDYERAAIYRDRLSALSAIQSHQGINPRSTDEADVFAVHQAGGYSCVEVFFFRTGQNWGNRAYFPKADRSIGPAEVLGAFLAQFYDDKPSPRLILVSHDFDERALLAEALTTKSGRKVEVSAPQRGERKELVQHALANAREALARKLADTSSQQKLLGALKETFSLPRPPGRIEVYDNSHIGGTNAVGAMVVAGPDGFRKNQYRKFNIRSSDLTPGDDYGMMREVLERRFKRLLEENPRVVANNVRDLITGGAEDQFWPDLLLIDGGLGQLNAAQDTLTALGIVDVAVVAIAKGPDRDAGRETFFMTGRAPFKLPPRDPLLYFIERLRDEAHRFAVGSHRTRRKKDIREAGLAR